MADREPIPAKLERALMIEAGYRCAVCKTPEPLEIEHIEEYSKVQEHSFTNMIVLCANCHSRKKNTSDPRHINKASLRKIKDGLMLVNARYSDLEKRFLEECQSFLKEPKNAGLMPSMMIHHTMWLQMKYLINDDLVTSQRIRGGMTTTRGQLTITNDELLLTLTPKGKDFALSLID